MVGILWIYNIKEILVHCIFILKLNKTKLYNKTVFHNKTEIHYYLSNKCLHNKTGKLIIILFYF